MKKKYASLGFRTSKGIKNIRLRLSPSQHIQTGFIISSGVQNLPPMPYMQQSGMPKMVDTSNGIELPEIEIEKPAKERKTDITRIDYKYPLIPSNPKKGERVYAYSHIFYHPKTYELIYNVKEPEIDEIRKKALMEIKKYIQQKVDIDFSQLRKKEAIAYLLKKFEKSLSQFRRRISSETKEIFKYYIIRDFIGLGKIEPLIKDSQIEDISCDGIGIPIYVYHRNPEIGSVKTNIFFETQYELDSFVNRLAERCGKTISYANPLLDGTLPDGSRVQATLGSDIARQGSNFTIRMFTEKPLTPTDIINYGTCDARTMAYLWMLVEYGKGILISGGTATGKTSMLNVLSLFIKPQMKIISIEDTSEIRLPHPHWVGEVARTPISEEGKTDMFDLLKASLRQRPDYVIVGEVRGKEAYVLFQQMAMGHSALSTIHSESFEKLIDRLSSPPINLPMSLIENLDVIVFLKRIKKARKYLRRIENIVEVVGYDRISQTPLTNNLIKWQAKTDEFEALHKSMVLHKIMENTDLTEGEVQEEIIKRMKIVEWMAKMNITDYKKINSIINMYYSAPDYLIGRIEGRI